MKIPIILTAVLCMACAANAAVDGFAKTLANVSGASSYTVPAGKVLILQQVSLPQGGAVSATITINASPGGTATISLPGANTNGIYRFTTPLFLPAGTVVGAAAIGSGSVVGLFGLLVDLADMPLFAGAGSSLQNVSVSTNTLIGEMRLPSTAPVVVRFQSSTNLVDWAFDSSVTVLPGNDKTRLRFSVARNGADRYYRALVHRTNNG
jgi:hypothetical protein